MSNNIKIFTNHTLDEYRKKYRNHAIKLICFKAKEVKEFAKKYHCDKDYLLKGRKWWLIDNTYYEVPKPLSFMWFSNIHIAYQIGTCLFFAVAISLAIVLPIILKDPIEISFDEHSSNIIESVEFIKKDNNYTAIINAKDKSKVIAINEIKKGETPLVLDTHYTYSMGNKELIIFGSAIKNIDGKVVVTVSANDKQWFNDQAYIDSLKESDIGLIKDVKVNGISHKVRLIDINHDIDENDNKIHTTWEFANLISDKEGYSLGYQWHDNNDPETSNYDYTNSSIRKALTGQGSFAHTAYCSSKSSFNKWDNNYTGKTVLTMLEPGLKSAIKRVKKNVRTGPTKDITSEYKDRLFMLSSEEIGYHDEKKSTGFTYSYYADYTWGKGVKKQVNNIEYNQYPNIDSKETIWKGRIDNFAGFNGSTNDDEGGYYWLCAPRSDYSYSSFYCNYQGNVFNGGYTYNRAYGVAPVFCL